MDRTRPTHSFSDTGTFALLAYSKSPSVVVWHSRRSWFGRRAAPIAANHAVIDRSRQDAAAHGQVQPLAITPVAGGRPGDELDRDCAFELPCREAADVDMIRAVSGIIAVPGELDLEFELVALHGRTTNRAVSADPWPAPHAVWVAVG